MRQEGIRAYLRDNWLVWLIAAQPLLDVLAFWRQDSVATVAGYIRLLIMVALPLVLLFRLKKKRNFILAMAAIGVFCALHAANCVRLGYINAFYDISYMAKVAQMPILAVCFVYFIRDEGMKKQTVSGVTAAAVITVAAFAAAVLTGTSTPTYSEGFGLSGWVPEDNRCANSILYVTLSTFSVYMAAKSQNKLANILVPAAVTFLLIINGTKACYLGLFAILFAYAAFLILEKPILRKKIRWLPLAVLVCLIVVSVLVYPISPRAKEDAAMSAVSGALQGEIEAAAEALGYDLNAMTLEEKINTPEIFDIFAHYYSAYMTDGVPDLFDRFGYEPVFRYFKMSTHVSRLIDTRQIKLCYSHLVWQQGDALTKLLGFEISQIGTDGSRDLENDWPALFYFYGYLGLALYAGFVLFFLFLVLKRLIQDFKGSFTLFNFCLFVCLLLQIGLAQFSGAVLRRPNVSIYLALVLALIYYQTVCLPVEKRA